MTAILGPGPITKVRAALGRAIRTAAQAALLVIGANVAGDGQVSIWGINWAQVSGVSGGMAAMSLLTSIAFPPPEVGIVVAEKVGS